MPTQIAKFDINIKGLEKIKIRSEKIQNLVDQLNVEIQALNDEDIVIDLSPCLS